MSCARTEALETRCTTAIIFTVLRNRVGELNTLLVCNHSAYGIDRTIKTKPERGCSGSVFLWGGLGDRRYHLI